MTQPKPEFSFRNPASGLALISGEWWLILRGRKLLRIPDRMVLR